jgi:hypothetical protein
MRMAAARLALRPLRLWLLLIKRINTGQCVASVAMAMQLLISQLAFAKRTSWIQSLLCAVNNGMVNNGMVN